MGLITWLYCELKNTILIPENGYIYNILIVLIAVI